jgi:hypothetical protein
MQVERRCTKVAAVVVVNLELINKQLLSTILSFNTINMKKLLLLLFFSRAYFLFVNLLVGGLITTGQQV